MQQNEKGLAITINVVNHLGPILSINRSGKTESATITATLFDLLQRNLSEEKFVSPIIYSFKEFEERKWTELTTG